MSGFNLILKDIEDKYVRENFRRLTEFVNDQVFFEGNFEFFEVDIKSADSNFKVKHSLKFIPQDIFFLAVSGDHNFYFKYQDFDRNFIYISANGPCVVRFLAGRLSELGRTAFRATYPLVAPTAGSGSVTNIVSLSPEIVVTNPTGPTVNLAFSAGSLTTPRVVATFTTDAGTAIGDLVRVNGVTTVTKITDNLTATIPNGVFGIVYAKPNATTANVIFMGIISGYAGFTTGSALFISTAGVPTHTPPATGMVQQIGHAVSTGSFFVQLMQPMRRS